MQVVVRTGFRTIAVALGVGPLAEHPLVIDLDGTLLRSDLLLETGLLFVRASPHRLLAPLLWVTGGKVRLKLELARATDIDVAILPYDQTVISFIEAEREAGRRVVLATASHRHLADRVAHHLQLFDEVIASDTGRNLSGDAKREALVQAFGERGFDYAGNSADDLPVWRAARNAYVVNPSRTVERRVRRLGNVAAVMRSNRATLRDWVGALRLHQWLKNLLILLPLLASHRYTELALVRDALVAVLCFSSCASSVYMLNDLLDLTDDRYHALKRHRPFASGRLTIQAGLIAVPLLLVLAFSIALWQLPLAFAVVLATYYGLTLAYSLLLKRRMVIDVIALAALYTLRVIAGAVALNIKLSFWMLAFAMFMFLSLALSKRYAELYQARAQGRIGRSRGRGYFPEDLQMIAALGAAAGYMAVMVMALYINDAQTTVLYSRPQVIWLACPLLLTWISRVWMLAHRGLLDEDPVVFAVRDRPSLVIGALLLLVFWAAT